MVSIGFLVIILNYLDAVLTTSGLAHGIIREANPLLGLFYSASPQLTFLGKVTLVPLGVIFVIMKGKDKPWVCWGLMICLLLYLWATGLHLLWLSKIF